MLPTLNIGPIAIPTYPFFVLLAFWAGMSLAARQADKLGIDGDHAYNAGLYGLISGILGARLWFVLSHWENYASDISQAFSLSRSALSVPEGLIIAGLVVLVYLQRYRVPLGTFFDAAAPGFALALAIINVGAFLGGVSLGVPADGSFGVAVGGVNRLPVQLYEVAGCLVIFSILYLSTYRPWPGFQFWLFVVLYAAVKMVVEIFRANPVTIGDGYLAVQMLALTAIVISLAVMAYFFTAPPENEHAESL
jgi:phosphatidylglycerol:prolipoprotein diacylglycerol transferase